MNHEGETRDCKFMIPLWQHVALHQQRVLSGRSISGMVTEALARHLAEAYPDLPDDARPPRS